MDSKSQVSEPNGSMDTLPNQKQLERSITFRATDIEIDFWEKFLDSGLFDAVYSIVATKIIVNIFLNMQNIKQINQDISVSQNMDPQLSAELAVFTQGLLMTLKHVNILTMLIGIEVFLITIITFMNYLFEWKSVVCRSCLLYKQVKQRKVNTIQNVTEYEIYIKKYNPSTTIIVTLDVGLWITITVLSFMWNEQIYNTQNQLEDLIGLIFNAQNLSLRNDYMQMRMALNLALDQYDQMRLLYLLTLAFFIVFSVWELMDYLTHHQVTQCFFSFFCCCCCMRDKKAKLKTRGFLREEVIARSRSQSTVQIPAQTQQEMEMQNANTTQ